MLLQPCSPFDMGDLRVLATARRTRVRLRVAVQRKSPHLKSVRSAGGSNLRRTCHAVGVRRVAQSAFTAHETKLTFFVISAPIARLRCLPGVSGLAHPLARPTGRLRRGSLRKLRFLRCIPIRLTTAPAVIRRHPPRNTSSGAPLASLRDAGLPRLTCVCHRLPANRVRSPHSARRAPLPSRFLITLRFSFCFSNFIPGSFFFSQLPSGIQIVSPNRIDAVSRRQYVRRGGPRTLTIGSARVRR